MLPSEQTQHHVYLPFSLAGFVPVPGLLFLQGVISSLRISPADSYFLRKMLGRDPGFKVFVLKLESKRFFHRRP